MRQGMHPRFKLASSKKYEVKNMIGFFLAVIHCSQSFQLSIEINVHTYIHTYIAIHTHIAIHTYIAIHT